jgi:hypothetical protein
VEGIGGLGELTGPALGQMGLADVRIEMPSFGFNLTMSPTFLIDGVFGHTRFKNVATGPDYGKNWGSEIWGIPGTNGGKAFASDIRYSGLDTPAHGGVYVPWQQMPLRSGFLVARTTGDPAALAGPLMRIVRDADPSLPLAPARTLDAVVDVALAPRAARFGLVGVFALGAALLGIVACPAR